MPDLDRQVAYVRRRLREGATDAELRLELLDQGLEADVIGAVMRAAHPPRRVHLLPLLAGIAVSGVGAALVVGSAALSVPAVRWWGLAVCAVGAGLVGRGLMPR
jgi:hypothetical protein